MKNIINECIIFLHCIHLLDHYHCFCCGCCCCWRVFTFFFANQNNEMGLESMPSIEYACEYYVLFTLFPIGLCAFQFTFMSLYIPFFFLHKSAHDQCYHNTKYKKHTPNGIFVCHSRECLYFHCSTSTNCFLIYSYVYSSLRKSDSISNGMCDVYSFYA